MNRCSSCQREFGYWEVWRSFWRAGPPRIECPSCGKRSSPAWVVLLLSFVLCYFWVVFSIRWGLDLEVPFLLWPLIFAIVGFLLSLPLPFFARYGGKPKDVDH